jgi:hypothetical protein
MGARSMMLKEPRVKNEKHLRFIRGLPCCVCHDPTSTEAAHVRYGCLESGKSYTGKATKPDDKWTVPLCGRHHRDQHAMNEKVFWLTVGIDPIKLCEALYAVSGNHEEGERIALSAHSGD